MQTPTMLNMAGDASLAPPDPGYNGPYYAGPAGSTLNAAKLGPECMHIIQRANLQIDDVICPNPLPTQPGAKEICTARRGGVTAPLTATFVTYNPGDHGFRIYCNVSKSLFTDGTVTAQTR